MFLLISLMFYQSSIASFPYLTIIRYKRQKQNVSLSHVRLICKRIMSDRLNAFSKTSQAKTNRGVNYEVRVGQRSK